MKRTMLALAVAVLAMAAIGCTDAVKSRWDSLGDPHKVEMWSGGTLVHEWQSTGAIENEPHSDGYYFMDMETKKIVRVTGDLVFTPIPK